MKDSQLLERFVGSRDQAAFRALVTRHGPTVLRACRSLLHDPFEVEDAFQATFLVLVQRAPSIRDPERLGNWLIGVANRVAARARRVLARRREREGHGAEMLTSDLCPEHTNTDLRDILREELDRHPDEYRLPLELCYLEGLTHEEAARRLGWPVGTVKVRLVRSRRLLRDRLERRGATLGVLLLLLRPRRATADVHPILVESTVDAMTRAASRRAEGVAAGRVGSPKLFSDLLWLSSGALRNWTLAGALILTVLATGAARLTEKSWLVEGEELAALPTGLMDVLSVQCR
jgi:RNA polymerase sigma factor (sigma-70 family)